MGEAQPDLPSWAPKPRVKAMIVGDSISQGHEGDYTWRFRLWEWLKNENALIDFVGPYTGTLTSDEPRSPTNPEPPSTVPRTSGGYAAGIRDFDSSHFSLWGHQAAQFKHEIQTQVKTYQPKILLVEMGFNDLGWFVSGPEGTLESMKSFVDNVRVAKSDVVFAIANVPQRTAMDGREDLPANTAKYNAMLEAAIPQWSTAHSPIKLVKFRENYQCELDGCPAAYDGLHPNALGEYQIARAFSITLHEFGIGDSILRIPRVIPKRPCPVPKNVVVESTATGMKVTWDAVYGSFGFDVRERIIGNEDWSVARVGANRYDRLWVTEGMEFEYQVRTNNERSGVSAWSVLESGIAHPKDSAQ